MSFVPIFILFGLTFRLAFAINVHLFGSPYFRSAMSARVSPDCTTYSSFEGAGSTGNAGGAIGAEGDSVWTAAGAGCAGAAPTPASRRSTARIRSVGGDGGGFSERIVSPASFLGVPSADVVDFGLPNVRSYPMTAASAAMMTAAMAILAVVVMRFPLLSAGRFPRGISTGPAAGLEKIPESGIRKSRPISYATSGLLPRNHHIRIGAAM